MFFVNLSQGKFDFSHQRLNTGVKDKTDRGESTYIHRCLVSLFVLIPQILVHFLM